MADYIMLFRFTENGFSNIKKSSGRIKEVRALFDNAGAKVKDVYAVLGRYDTVWIVQAPDDETIARLSLQISALGAVHAETLRAFNEAQYQAIVEKIS